MSHALMLIGWNVSTATLLATVFWLACRTRLLRQRPALAHGLWLLVLLKLVVPPVVLVAILPDSNVVQRGQSAQPATYEEAALGGGATLLIAADAEQQAVLDAPLLPRSNAADDVVSTSPRQARPSLEIRWANLFAALIAVSLAGSLVLWIATARQFLRLRRLLHGSETPPLRLVESLRAMSLRFKLRKRVSVLVVDAPVTPMLWANPANPTIIIPRDLAASLAEDQLQNVIAHELAHLVRYDHWSSAFAFAVTTIFWWNPVAWLARRQMNAAAEACCDALAVERSNGSRKSYAETLLAVVNFVSTGQLVRPAWCVTFGESRTLRRRFEMLMESGVRSSVSRLGWMLLALVSTSLVLLPARAQQESQAPKPSRADTAADAPAAQASPTEPGRQTANADSKYYITGKVLDIDTGEPIADADVRILVDSEQDPAKRGLKGVTDADGKYQIEVPLGSVRLWFPRLKPGYWLEPEQAMATLVTTAEAPVVTHDIVAHHAVAWPTRVVVDGGIPDGAELMVSVTEVEDDAIRQKWLKGVGVSLAKSPNQSISELSPNGLGAFTQCGTSGKLIVGLGGGDLDSIMTELVVEPGFNIAKIKTITPGADTDKITMTDEAGATATIGKAEVSLHDGLPLLTFRLVPRVPQSVQRLSGQVVDEAGAPEEAVRVGVIVGSATGGGDTRIFTTTDKDGRFVLDAPIPESEQKHWVNLVFTKDGYASFDSQHFDLPQKASDTIDCGKLTLAPACSVPVRTVDENDRPLAGAIVEPLGDYAQRRQTIRTNEQGYGILRNLPAGVIPLRAVHGPLTNQSKIVADAESADGEEVTLRLREVKPAPAQPQPMPEPPPLGAVAPELSIVDWTDGQARKLADYRGKVVVLDFWGIWCSACLNGLPARKELEAKYTGRSDVVFLGIHSAGTDMSQVKKLQKLKDWTLITGLDQGDDVVSGITARAYGARGWPTTVIIDREGKIAYNSNLEKWDALTSFRERTRIVKALNLPPQKPEASFEDQVARTNAVNVYRLSELIDGVLGEK